MMRFVAGLLLGLIAVQLYGCALPVADREHQSFVPDKELSVVSLVREGLNDFKKNRFFEAEAAFRKALFLYPSASNVKANLAIALKANGEFDEAEDILLALVVKEPKSVDHLVALARLYSEKNDFSESRKYFNQAFEAYLGKQDFSGAALVARSLAALAFRLGDEQSALCHSSVALSLQRDSGEMQRHTRLLLAMQKSESARLLLGEYLNQPGVTQSPELMHQLALAHFSAKNYKNVIDLEREAMDSVGADKNLMTEIQLVQQLAEERLPKNPESQVVESKDSEKLQERVNAILQGSDKATLYWPVELIQAVQEVNYSKSQSG